MLAAAKTDCSREFYALKEENERLKRVLEERKLIEKAKGILMKKDGIPEDEAYRKIQKLSMDKRKKMAEIAEAIIIAEEVAK
jgi:response regulator NasT